MTAEILSQRQRRLSLGAVIAGVFGVGLAFGALIPLIALRLEREGVDTTLIGLNAAMFPIAVLVVGPALPRLIGRLGTLRSLYLGLAVGAAAILLLPAFPTLEAWFLLRFVIGAASAIHWVVSETWMNMIATDRDRGRVMGVYATVLAAGFAAGPLIVGAVGIDGWLPFALVAAAVAFSAVPLLFAHGVAPPMPHHPAAGLRRMIVAAPTVMLAALAAGFVDMALFALLPLHGLRAGFDQAAAVAMLSVFVAGNLLLQIPLGWLADRTNRRGVLLVCVGGSALGAALLPGLIGGPWLWVMLFFWGGAAFGVYTVGLALLGERFPRLELAGANTAFVMIYEVGSVTGPVAAGGAMDLWPQGGLLLSVGLAAGLFLLFGLGRALARARR